MKSIPNSVFARGVLLLASMTIVTAACGQSSVASNGATSATIDANRHFSERLSWEDREDFELAQRGFIATLPELSIKDQGGNVVWDMQQFSFQALDAATPDTVNPSLWRQAQLNTLHGLFKVTDKIYQVRGFDLSNITFIEGDSGYIVIDPLITAEAAGAALQLVYEHLPEKPVVAVIYSHSHADHFGGVKGVVNEADVAAGEVRIIASQGFMKHAVSENVLAGNVMTRRAFYMFGALLPKNATGGVGAGLGKAISSGEITLIEPTDIISTTGQELVVDGVRIVFMNTPFAEAPAETMFYFPELRAFYAAEEANATLHNLYTLRGAQVRDALLWSTYLDEAIDSIDAETEVLFGGHHWPRWGHESIVDYLGKQRDAYKYIHDQTLRLANQGFTATEIAEMVELPDALARAWFNRGYYGTVSHNVKAVYQKYLGWFDGNPANIEPLPPVESAVRYVDFMGGADAVLQKARQAYDDADYRWVVEVVNHVVFADPDNVDARHLQADALEQLGYQAESGQWRNFYLTGASELRNGIRKAGKTRTASADIVRSLSLDLFFDFLAVRLNGPMAAGVELSLEFSFTDIGQEYLLTVQNGVMRHKEGGQGDSADAKVRLTRDGLIALALQGKPVTMLVNAGMLQVEGDAGKLEQLLSLLDSFEFWFNIVTP